MIYEAILKSYDYNSLERVMAFSGYSLEQITLKDNFRDVVSDVVSYFSQQGKLNILIKLLKENSESQYIQELKYVPMFENELMDYSSIQKHLGRLDADVKEIREFLVGTQLDKKSGLINKVDSFESDLAVVKDFIKNAEIVQRNIIHDKYMQQIFSIVAILGIVSLIITFVVQVW